LQKAPLFIVISPCQYQLHSMNFECIEDFVPLPTRSDNINYG